MRRRNRWSERMVGRTHEALSSVCGERGSAPLEFIVVGLILLVPLVYLITALGIIQSHTLGVESGARQLARVVATAPDTSSADARARSVLASMAREYGMNPAQIGIEFTCVPVGGDCPRAGVTLLVSLSTRVALPLVPPILGADQIASVPVSAAAAQKVSRFWGAP